MMRTVAFSAVVIGMLTAARAGAQAPGTFEVAIKLTAPGATGSRISAEPGGRLVATNITLRALIRNAYSIDEARIVGGPAWIDADRFDITAKAAGPQPTIDEMRVMLQSLLQERFALTTHRERREMSVLALVNARQDGSLAKGFRRSETDCVTGIKAASPEPSTDSTQARPCGIRLSRTRVT